MQWDLQALSDFLLFSMCKMLKQKLEFIPVCLELPTCIASGFDTCLSCKEEILWDSYN